MSERLTKNLRLALPLFLLGYMLCVFGELGKLYNEKELFVINDSKGLLLADFNAFYNGALLSRDYHQHGTPIYDYDVQTRSLSNITAPVKVEPTMLSLYPPHFLLALEPLSYLPIYPAWIVWSGFILISMALSLYLIDLPAIRERYDRICCAIALVCSSPTFSNFRLGQSSFFLLTGMLVVWRLLETRRYFLAGLSTMLCMFKPQYLPVLITAGLIAGKMRFLLGCVTAAAIVAGISIASYGLDNLKAWPALIKIAETQPDVAATQSIRGELTLLLGGSAEAVPSQIVALLVAASVIFTAWLWWRYRNRLQDKYLFRLLAGLSVTAAIFGSPHTHVQDYVLFFSVGGVWTWGYIQNLSIEKRKERALTILLTVLPFVSWAFLVLQAIFMLLRIEPFFLYALAIFCLTLRMLLRAEPK